jgi:hypothetical protein
MNEPLPSDQLKLRAGQHAASCLVVITSGTKFWLVEHIEAASDEKWIELDGPPLTRSHVYFTQLQYGFAPSKG